MASTPVDRQDEAATAFKRPDPQSILDDAGGNVDNVLGAESDDDFQDAEGDDNDDPAHPVSDMPNQTRSKSDPVNSERSLAEPHADSDEAGQAEQAVKSNELSPSTSLLDAEPSDSRGDLFNADDPDAEASHSTIQSHLEAQTAPATKESEQAAQYPSPRATKAQPPASHNSTPPADPPPPPQPQPSISEPTVSSEELQAQVADLKQQVTSLNSKLVQSFERMADCEDDLLETETEVGSSGKRLMELTRVRKEHLAAVSTGAILEKSRVSSEMQKMMDRVLEETQQRGKFESDRKQIQQELDELSTSLFDEANRMVASERLARSRAQEKSDEMEHALQKAETEMLEQQRVLAMLQRQIELRQRKVPDGLRLSVSELEGEKDVPAQDAGAPRLRITSLVRSLSEQEGFDQPSVGLGAAMLPSSLAHESIQLNVEAYREFVAFLTYVRRQRLSLRPYYEYDPAATHRLGAVPPNPFMVAGVGRHKDFPSLPSTADSLVQLSAQDSHQPFLRRAQEEDVEPCLRLDCAPGLGWLNRRSAQTAILDGHLVIEPLFPGGIVPDAAAERARLAHLPLGCCTLCGMPVLNVLADTSVSATDRKSNSSWASLTGSAASLLETARRKNQSPASTSHHGNSSGDVADGSETDATPSNDNVTAPSHTRSVSDKSTPTATGSSRRTFLSGLRLGSASPKPDRNADASPAGLGLASRLSTGPTSQATVQESLPIPTTEFEPVIPTHIFRTSESSTNRYLLCPQHCLARLRAVCAFWSWVRRLEREIILEGKQPWKEEHTQSVLDAKSVTTKPVEADEMKPTTETAGEEKLDDKDDVSVTPTQDAKPTDAETDAPAADAAADAAGSESQATSQVDTATNSVVGTTPQETITLGGAAASWEQKLFQELISHKLTMGLARVGFA